MSAPSKLWAPKFFTLLGLIIAAGFIYFAVVYGHYYLLPVAQRPLHPHHDVLRSSGYAGLTFGAVGTLLVLLNLSYLIRKLFFRASWLGHLRSWMSFHVVTGITAYLLILLHSDFLLRSALGSLALVAFTIVVFTGLVGRYIYAHTPRSLEGTELEIDEVRQRLKSYRTDLERLGMPKDLFQTVLETSKVATEDKSILSTIWTIMKGDQKLKATYNKLFATVHHSPQLSMLAPEIMPLALSYYRELEWLNKYHELRGLMSSWRFFHRWLALVMVAAVVFHIIVAQTMGNLWLFNSMGLHQYMMAVHHVLR